MRIWKLPSRHIKYIRDEFLAIQQANRCNFLARSVRRFVTVIMCGSWPSRLTSIYICALVKRFYHQIEPRLHVVDGKGPFTRTIKSLRFCRWRNNSDTVARVNTQLPVAATGCKIAVTSDSLWTCSKSGNQSLVTATWISGLNKKLPEFGVIISKSSHK